jgi:hypothetical protein
MASSIDTGIISLYYALKPEDIDIHQFATADQAPQFSLPPVQAIGNLSDEVNLEDRQHRYAAALAYALGTRVLAQDDSVSSNLQTLGSKIIGRIHGIDDPEGGEISLRRAMRRLTASSEPKISDEIASALLDAFKGGLELSFDSEAETWLFSGDAAETATMLCELASMQMDCQGREGHVRVGHQLVPVTVIEYELCTQSPFTRTAPGVDPRNWTTYNPFFFDSIEVLTPAPASSTGTWNGVIQEKVGALYSGSSVVTNLAVSYVEQPGLAAVSYDLAPAGGPFKADDNTVTVDYGLFAVMEEGIHRRVRMLKVLHIDGKDMNHEWMCPLWAHQLAMIGWWF